MALEEQQIVIKWRSLSELKEKLKSMLGELDPSALPPDAQAGVSSSVSASGETIPDEVRKLDLSPFSEAMLTVLKDGHRGRSNAVDARSLAKEMKARYPRLFSRKEIGAIAHGTIFPGGKLAKDKLIRMEKMEDSQDPPQKYRLYWSE
jgi:hypothetical protein